MLKNHLENFAEENVSDSSPSSDALWTSEFTGSNTLRLGLDASDNIHSILRREKRISDNQLTFQKIFESKNDELLILNHEDSNDFVQDDIEFEDEAHDEELLDDRLALYEDHRSLAMKDEPLDDIIDKNASGNENLTQNHLEAHVIDEEEDWDLEFGVDEEIRDAQQQMASGFKNLVSADNFEPLQSPDGNHIANDESAATQDIPVTLPTKCKIMMHLLSNKDRSLVNTQVTAKLPDFVSLVAQHGKDISNIGSELKYSCKFSYAEMEAILRSIVSKFIPVIESNSKVQINLDPIMKYEIYTGKDYRALHW